MAERRDGDEVEHTMTRPPRIAIAIGSEDRVRLWVLRPLAAGESAAGRDRVGERGMGVARRPVRESLTRGTIRMSILGIVIVVILVLLVLGFFGRRPLQSLAIRHRLAPGPGGGKPFTSSHSSWREAGVWTARVRKPGRPA